MADIYEPTITVTDVENTVTRGGGMAGVVCMIGAFPTDDATIKSYTDLRTAQSELKGDATSIPDDALGYNALPYLFNRDNGLGIEELIVVNITTTVSDALNYDLTNDKLAAALDLIKDEHFNILFVADVLTETQLANIKSLRDDMYAAQLPWGLIAPVDVSTTNEVKAVSAVFATGGAYKLITTQKQLESDAEPLSLVNTAAYDVSITAGNLVNISETGTIIPGVSGLNTKEALSNIYETILECGLHSQKVINRRLGQVITNNVMTPTGRDMAIERTKDYIVADLALRDIFGNPNITATYDYVKGLFKGKKQAYTDLGLINDMNYEITECSSRCVKAELDLDIPDIIDEIRLFVKVTPSTVELNTEVNA